MLDTQALSRLTKSHPEVLRYIQQVAKTRKEAAEADQAENRRRKPRQGAVQSKRNAPETL
ncbi:MAG TPA: hypothetical protein VFD26_06195 [Methyloceanibacter sp.]|nr:hypothetical protein [Methyloceanibacter sp.]